MSCHVIRQYTIHDLPSSQRPLLPPFLFLLPPQRLHLRSALSPLARALLPLTFKVRTRREERNALVHDRLADPEVVVDPLLDAWCLAELVWLYTRTVSGVLLAWVLVAWDSVVKCGKAGG